MLHGEILDMVLIFELCITEKFMKTEDEWEYLKMV